MPLRGLKRPRTDRKVLADGLVETELESVSDQGVTDRYLGKEGDRGQERRQVIEVEVVSRVDAEPQVARSLGRLDIRWQHPLRLAAGKGIGIRLGVQLDAVGAEGGDQFNLPGDRVHEQADATAEGTQDHDDRTETLALSAEVPTVVAGEGIGAVGDEGTLRRAILLGELCVLMEGIALDVELGLRMRLEEFGDLVDIVRPDMALVGPGMDGDAVGARVEGDASGLEHAGDTIRARVPQRRDLVDIDTETGHRALERIVSLAGRG